MPKWHPVAGPKLTVLIAEDDDDDYLFLEEAFRSGGDAIRVERARDGEELLRLLEEQGDSPLLVLTDLSMPRLDGWQVLQRIRADPRLRHIPVVVVTGTALPSDGLRAYQLGANSFIRKPMAFGRIRELFRVLVRYWCEVSELPPPAARG